MRRCALLGRWLPTRILIVVAVFVLMVIGCLGGCGIQAPEDQSEEPPEMPVILAITSNDETVIPYRNLLWSETWTEESGWVSADAESVFGDLDAVIGELPTITLREDINLSCEDNVALGGLNVYSADDYKRMYLGADRSLVMGLPEGTYYCSIEAEETGRYVESDVKYEKSCSEYVFCFVVDEHSYDNMLRSRQAGDGVSVMLRPTESRGISGYHVPKDQDAWLEALRLAEESAADGAYLDEEVSLGIWIMFDDGYWQVMDSGSLVGYSMDVGGSRRIEKEQASNLCALVSPIAEKYYGSGIFRPDMIEGIVSATLTVLDQTYTITDEAVLAQLETLLAGVTEHRGGTKCPFGAILNLEMQAGSRVTLAVASDSCRVYMVNGAYFEYGDRDNGEFYGLFGVSMADGAE